MNTPRRLLIALLACTPVLAAAHPGHDASSSVAAGLLHPLMGIDHLVAALLAGAWGAQRGGSARLLLPGGFLVAVIAGLLFAPAAAITSTATEQLIAASLMVMGAGVALAWRIPTGASVALAAAFAFFHGLAHGAEHTGGALLAYGAGLAATTALLLTLGTIGGLAMQGRHGASLLRWAGFAGIAGGLAMLG